MRHKLLSKRGTKIRNLNRRRAIRHHCLVCSNFNWSEVVNCRLDGCRLHRFRFGTIQEQGLTPRDRDLAIKGFCSDCVGGAYQEVVNCDAQECALHPFRKFLLTF